MRIKQLREAKGWSQERLAREAKLSARTVGRIEREGKAHTDTLNAIAEALGVGPGQLFEEVA